MEIETYVEKLENQGENLIIDFQTDITNGDTFYTDSNGL